jgi:hypothetical protein
MVMFNKENKDREFNIEFNLNRKSSLARTIIAEYYGPYTIKANNITIAAYRYKFSSNLIGSNYTLKAGLFEKGKKLAESEQILDLTKILILEKPISLSSRLTSFILKNIIYLIIILASMFLAVIMISIYRHERANINRSIEHYKEKRSLAKIAKKARKRRKHQRKIREYQEKKRRKSAKRAAKIRTKQLEFENGVRRRAAKLRGEKLEQQKKEKEKTAKKAIKSREQRLEERRETMFKTLAETKRRKIELKRLEERREVARKAARLRAEKLEQKTKTRKKAAKRAVKVLTKRVEQERKLQLKREEAKKIIHEIRKIGKKTKKKR